jgi:hypothetical protein
MEEDLLRAGYKVGPATGEEIFDKILREPGGVRIGVMDAENNLAQLETSDRRIPIYFPDMESWMKEVHRGLRRDGWSTRNTR